MITNRLFALCLPTVNRVDLLNPTLERYVKEFFPHTWVLIVDNGNQPIYKHENITVLKQKENRYVSASWNILCNNVFLNYEYCLLLNDDILLDKTDTDIKRLIEENPRTDFFKSMNQWESVIIPKKTYQRVGEFDESMKIWFSDCSYEYRMKKERLNVMNTSMLNPSIFRKDGSVEREPMFHRMFELDRQAYIKKHGASPGAELY